MLRIPKRPTELALSLPSMADMEDAPVFYFRPMTDQEEAVFMMRMLQGGDVELPPDIDPDTLSAEEAAALIGSAGVDVRHTAGLLIEVFDAHLLRIERLEVECADGVETFDRARHLADIPGAWKLNLGQQVTSRTRNPLALAAEGNSSSPSSSAATAQTIDDAPEAAVARA